MAEKRREREAAEAAIRAALPPRAREGHKGSYGHAYLFCGSATYTGAALLAAEGALRMGAGKVSLCSVPEVLSAARSRLPELILYLTPPLAAASTALRPLLLAEGALLLGPGVGMQLADRTPADPAAFAAMLEWLLAREGMPVVLDADALNLLAAAGEVPARLRRARRPVLLTPHPLELSRLSGWGREEIAADRVGRAAAFAVDCRATVILKGAGTVIASPDGSCRINPSGTPALAKGGSGDVLAGMLVSLLAQGLSPLAAATAAVYLHGLAGERLALRFSQYGVLPSELPAAAACELARILA